MKTIVVALSFLAAFSSYGSSFGIARAANSKAIKGIESKLTKEGFELKTIRDIEAGEGYRSKCACSYFVVTFQKSEMTENGLKRYLKKYRLEISGLSDEEVVAELPEEQTQ